MRARLLRACALSAILALLLSMGAANAAIGWGDSGDKVLEIQKKLKAWGYLEGGADGKYGAKTEQAVRAFQRKNGLKDDGVVGDATAAKLGVNLGGSSGGGSGYQGSQSGGSGNNDVYLLARCIYGEGRGEPYKGKVAIGAVVLNRVKSPEFPNSIAGVIYQPGAFSIVSDGQINLAPNEECIKAARDAMNGWDPTGGCVFYFNPAKTNNKYMHSKTPVITIGAHVFTM